VVIRFWGVRGSLPTPLTPAQVRSKISSVVERIGLSDIGSEEARERFLADLPESLFSTIGGNTACVEIGSEGGVRIILDAGTGIRELGLSLAKERKDPLECHIFFSHYHWDHIQGLPFFAPLGDPRNDIHFYSPIRDFEETIRGQMRTPYFPVTLDVMRARKTFHVLDGRPLSLRGIEVNYKKMNHPGGSYSYAFSRDGKKIIYSTDTELTQSDFQKRPDNHAYFQDADALIIDAQYTLDEAIEKFNWGHSAFSVAADFAACWRIKKLILFHHEPNYTDRKLFTIQRAASWYISHLEASGTEVTLAREGMEIEI
jgi:phosphoribosyl 1,2-cyclic phosphodiesterase